MRKTIAITTRPKKAGGKEEIRLFTMNKRQSDLFVSVTQGLATAGNLPLQQAAEHVEKAVVKMLDGRMPREDSPRVFLEMRLAFPVLRPKDVHQLPRAGCPRGRITAVVLGVVVPEQVKTPKGKQEVKVARTVLIELDHDQANWHGDAMREIMERDGCSKDDAWLWVNNLIGQLLAGAELKTDHDQEMILMRASALFSLLSVDDVRKLPLATEDDVRRWSFTLDRPHD